MFFQPLGEAFSLKEFAISRQWNYGGENPASSVGALTLADESLL